MKLLSWNIQHGGGKRSSRIVEAILEHAPDVVALTEFRTRSGAFLIDALRAKGYHHSISTNPAGTDNGVCVIARTPIVRMGRSPAPPENRVRWLDVSLPEYGFSLGAMHILCSLPGSLDEVPGAAKIRFWNAVVKAASTRFDTPCLFVGDWNTGLREVDEKGKSFVCADHFARLSTMGWTDLWRHFHTESTEFTWYSKYKGGARANGFRLDHAFATPSLLARVQGCLYSHAEREAGVSDHSVTIVEME